MAQKKKYKTMMVREEIWRKLTKQKRGGESYSDLLARLCDTADEVDNAGGITSKFAGDLMTAIGRLTQEVTGESKKVQTPPPSETPPKKEPEKVSKLPKSETAQSGNIDDAMGDGAYQTMLDAFDNPPKKKKSSGIKNHDIDFGLLGVTEIK